MPKFAPLLALLASAGPALAHPGHDAAVAHGSSHWLTEPSHWIVLALSVVVAAEIGRRVVRALVARRTDPQHRDT